MCIFDTLPNIISCFEIALFIAFCNISDLSKNLLWNLRRKYVMLQCFARWLLKIGIYLLRNLALNPIKPQITPLEIIIIW